MSVTQREVNEAVTSADAMIAALCLLPGQAGYREWSMSWPARPDHDPDLVIGKALRFQADRIAELERQCGAGTTGVELIQQERVRQISAEGWTPKHDDGHVSAELTNAACAYAEIAAMQMYRCVEQLDLYTPECWPWHDEQWKPAPEPIRNLVKAGALLAADIDRLLRAQSGSGAAPMTADIVRAEVNAPTEFRKELPDVGFKGILQQLFRELHELRGEVKIMSQTLQDQVAQLTSDVAALTTAYTNFKGAVATEIATLSASPAAADPNVATAIANIEALTAGIVADTAAAAPPASTMTNATVATADPTTTEGAAPTSEAATSDPASTTDSTTTAAEPVTTTDASTTTAS